MDNRWEQPFLPFESIDAGNRYRIQYQQEMDGLITTRQAQSAAARDAYLRDIAREPERYRMAYRDMLGWPLNAEPTPILGVEEEVVFENDNLTVTRALVEVFAGFRFYGMLFRLKDREPRPLVIAQHGGAGSPELCSGTFGGTENYNRMTERLLKHGVHAFAPQTILWRDEYGTRNRRDEFDNSLKQLGGSVTALEIYCLSRCIDWLETLPFVTTIGMAGLSYGGFYTLYTAASDTRIRAALACGHFNNRLKYSWLSKSWKNAAHTFLDAEVGALIYPRFLRIEVGRNDELFDAAGAEVEYERLKRYYAGHSACLQFCVFDGVHEFPRDDVGIAALIAALDGGEFARERKI